MFALFVEVWSGLAFDWGRWASGDWGFIGRLIARGWLVLQLVFCWGRRHSMWEANTFIVWRRVTRRELHWIVVPFLLDWALLLLLKALRLINHLFNDLQRVCRLTIAALNLEKPDRTLRTLLLSIRVAVEHNLRFICPTSLSIRWMVIDVSIVHFNIRSDALNFQ